VDVVFWVAAGASFVAAALLVRLRYDAPPRPPAPSRPNLAKEAVEGVRVVVQSRDLTLILGLAAAQALTRGALTVFSVVVAIELLGTGEPGVGALMTAVGVGAVLGSLFASLLVGSGRLGAWYAVGVGLWGLPLTLVALVPQQSAALGLLAFIGVGNALIDLAGFTLIARMAPDEVLARVFGVLESLVAVFIGIGAVVASSMIEWVGVQNALIVIGLVCPVLAVVSLRRLRGLDRSVDVLDADIGLLQEVPMFHPLPLPAVEQLARGLEPVTVAADQVVFRQGDVGDRYYVIESGEAEVVGDGRVVATLGPGEGFGEIALLRRTRRTATVVARSELLLQALGSDRFLPVVLGYTPSAQQAAAVVDDRLERYEPKEPFEEPPASA
jgi:CRP-like cAMP-binding protein